MTDYPEFEFNEDDIIAREVVELPQAATERTLARRLALQALYEIDTTTHTVGETLNHFLMPTSTLTFQEMLSAYMPPNFDYDSSKLRSIVDTVAHEHDIEGRLLRYFEFLVRGVLDNLAQLDVIVQRYAPEFPISQVSIVDRNILRIAVFELAIEDKLSQNIIISEAVDLSLVFGSDSTLRFVNGVLATIADDIDNETLALRGMLRNNAAPPADS